jgi:FkbM family methyltransferase
MHVVLSERAILLKNVKTLTKAVFRFCGLDIRRVPQFEPHEWLKEMDIRTVLDIGANVGEFATMIRGVLPVARIYSFEPLEVCYKELKKLKIGNFEAFDIALSDINGELEFHKNEHLPSSSALSMTDLHKQNYPYTVNNSLIKVKCIRLDDIATKLNIQDNLLVKIDVQGLENRVVTGGENTIRRARILIIETSFQVLYAGQPLFEDIYDLLKRDFKYMGSWEKSRTSQIDGSPLFEDSIFLNKSSNHCF